MLSDIELRKILGTITDKMLEETLMIIGREVAKAQEQATLEETKKEIDLFLTMIGKPTGKARG